MNILMRLDAKRRIVVLAIAGLLLIGATYIVSTAVLNSQFKVFYSLDKRHNDVELVHIIDQASSYAYFAIYYFTKDSIADALVRAKKRGVKVAGIMDREASTASNRAVLEKLIAAGIPVETQKHPEGIMHMKVLVTDKAYASGSYNWTASATSQNDEVLEIGTNSHVRTQYLSIINNVLSRNK